MSERIFIYCNNTTHNTCVLRITCFIKTFSILHRRRNVHVAHDGHRAFMTQPYLTQTTVQERIWFAEQYIIILSSTAAAAAFSFSDRPRVTGQRMLYSSCVIDAGKIETIFYIICDYFVNKKKKKISCTICYMPENWYRRTRLTATMNNALSHKPLYKTYVRILYYFCIIITIVIICIQCVFVHS
jgi:hypothetical protein